MNGEPLHEGVNGGGPEPLCGTCGHWKSLHEGGSGLCRASGRLVPGGPCDYDCEAFVDNMTHIVVHDLPSNCPFARDAWECTDGLAKMIQETGMCRGCGRDALTAKKKAVRVSRRDG